AYVNFNYDTLFEKAYSAVFHKNFTNLDDYINENIIKPHGSINWILNKRKTDQEVPSSRDTRLKIDLSMRNFYINGKISMENSQFLDPNLEYLRDNDIARAWESLSLGIMYPLIFLPISKKDFTHIETFSEKVIEKGREIMGRADEIYIIGYRARDYVIRDLIMYAPSGCVLNVISESHAKEISEYVLSWAGQLKRGTSLNGGFSAFIAAPFTQ
ncbi:MAG: hypothetical protein UU34_C0004G0001, partial [Candidatus Curtissbacteria bacterium GW2011_GWA1_41_11]